VAKLSVRVRSSGEGLVGERRRETSSVSRSKVLGSSMAPGRERRARVWWEAKVCLVTWSGRHRLRVCACVGTVLGICGFVLFLLVF
jgi:hypothetical protein